MEGDALADVEDFVRWLGKDPRGIAAAASDATGDDATGEAATKQVQADEGTDSKLRDGNTATGDAPAKQVQADEGTDGKLRDGSDPRDATAKQVQADEGTGETIAPEVQLDYGNLPKDFAAWFNQHGTDLEWEVNRARSHAKFPLWVAMNDASDKPVEDQCLI